MFVGAGVRSRIDPVIEQLTRTRAPSNGENDEPAVESTTAASTAAATEALSLFQATNDEEFSRVRLDNEQVHADEVAATEAAGRAGERPTARPVLFGRLDLVDPQGLTETVYLGPAGRWDAKTGRQLVVDWRSDLGATFNRATRHDPMGVGRRRVVAMRDDEVVGVHDETLTDGFHAGDPGDAMQLVLDLTDGSNPPSLTQPVTSAVTAAVTPVGTFDLGLSTDGDVSGPAAEWANSAGRPSVWASEVELDRIGVSLRHPVGLVSALSRPTAQRRGHVLETMQADQDWLVRCDPTTAIVIEGPAGTGKTTVGLHRVAWVLHELGVGAPGTAASALVLTPNESARQHALEVLEGLGVSSASVDTIETLLGHKAGDPAAGAQTLSRPRADDEAEALKGDVRLAGLLRVAVWMGCRANAVTVVERGVRAVLGRARVEAIIESVFDTGVSYDDGRHGVMATLATELADQIIARKVDGLDGGAFGLAPQADQNAASASERRVAMVQRIARELRSSGQLDALLPDQQAAEVLERLLGDDGFRQRANDDLSAAEVALLGRSKGAIRAWTAADLVLIDELSFILHGRSDRFDHVFVDDATDLSPMQWRCVERRLLGESITIAGDLGQDVSPWSDGTTDRSWSRIGELLELENGLDVKRCVLAYRRPLDLDDPVAVLEPIPIEERSVEPGEVEQWILQTVIERAETGGSVVVITEESNVIRIDRLLRRPVLNDADISVVADRDISGHEADHVVLVKPTEVVRSDGERGRRRLRRALSRATHSVTVIAERDSVSARDLVSRSVPRPAATGASELLEFALLVRLRAALSVGAIIETVSHGRRFRIESIGDVGVVLSPATPGIARAGATDRVTLVPAWMFRETWRLLGERTTLRQSDLAAGTFGDPVAHSAEVFAVLARLATVEVVNANPAELRRLEITGPWRW